MGVLQYPYIKYKYAVVLVLRAIDIRITIEKLQKYNIDCQIDIPFERLNVKGSTVTGLCYLDEPFQDFLDIISFNKEF